MHIEQIYTGCLAQGAYFVSSEGEEQLINKEKTNKKGRYNFIFFAIRSRKYSSLRLKCLESFNN